MARKLIVALVLFSLLGLAFATSPAEAPVTPVTEESTAASSGPSSEVIGNDEGAGEGVGFAEAAPAGGPVPEGTFKDVPTDEATADAGSPKKNGASTLELSSIVAGVAGFSLFYF